MARLWGRKPLLLLALFTCAGAAWFLWWTHRTLDETREQVSREGVIRFAFGALDEASLPGLEPMAATASNRDAAVFQDHFWVLSSAAVSEYDAAGALVHRYRCGVELPPAPLVRIVSGVIGSGEPQLLIATAGEGLMVFDGRAFRQLRGEHADYRKLTSLLVLDSGQLLLGTEKAGVLAWDGTTLSLFHDSLKGVPVTALAGKLDDLWVGTPDRGVMRLHAGQLEKVGVAEGLPDAHVLSLAVDKDSAFAGTAMGVAEFQSGKLRRPVGDGLFAQSLFPAGDQLLVGTLEEGVMEIPLASRAPRQSRARTALPGSVQRIFASGGDLYAVFRDGLYTRGERGSDWRRVTLPDQAPLSDNNISALALDPSQRLWVGYFDRGLDILDPGSSRALHREDDHLFCVNRIVTRKDGAVIATANGLVMADRQGNPRQVLGRSEGLIASHVTDIVVENDGIVAATPAGITFLAPGGPQSIYAFHGLVNNHVYSLARNGNRILAGTLGGVSVLDDGVVKASFTTANSALRHNWISALVPVGNEWFAGTYGAGVFRYDGALWHNFSDLRGSLEVNPNAMATTENAVFAGTLTRGLAVYNRANGRWGFQTAGLPSLNVTAVAASNGWLYIGSDNGLIRIAERSLPLP